MVIFRYNFSSKVRGMKWTLKFPLWLKKQSTKKIVRFAENLDFFGGLFLKTSFSTFSPKPSFSNLVPKKLDVVAAFCFSSRVSS